MVPAVLFLSYAMMSISFLTMLKKISNPSIFMGIFLLLSGALGCSSFFYTIELSRIYLIAIVILCMIVLLSSEMYDVMVDVIAVNTIMIIGLLYFRECNYITDEWIYIFPIFTVVGIFAYRHS